MKKNFAFMLLNTIFLPLTEITTIKVFINYIMGLHWQDLPTAFSKNLAASYFFFLRYMI